EFTNSIPPATTGPAPSSDPPLVSTPFTAEKLLAVSKSHSTLPSSAAKARRCPSTEPEKTTPGIAVTACDCAGLQPGRGGSHGFGAANQILVPSAGRNAVNPPPFAGSNFAPPMAPPGFSTPAKSEVAAKTDCPSLAIPHCTPPFFPPSPTRVCQRILPFASGSNPYTMPDFCPATRISFPFGNESSSAEEPKS